MAVEQRRLPPSWTRPDVLIGAGIAVALAIAFIVWLLVRGDGGSSAPATTTEPQTSTVEAVAPRAASQTELRALAVRLGHAIYWVGSEQNSTYELTVTSSGRIFVRYLSSGVQPGTKSSKYTFVGTYPFSEPYQALKGLATEGDVSLSVPGGGLAVYAPRTPTNIYVAFPRQNVEIEVYDPSPKRARSLVASGQVQPVR